MRGKAINIYTIVLTGIDTDRGLFPDPSAAGSYLSLDRARAELERLISEKKETLDGRYDCEERGEDSWEAYMDGYAAALCTRVEILTSQISTGELRADERALWARLGVSLAVSGEEERAILGGDRDLAAGTLRKIVEEGRFAPDGECYVPESAVSDFNKTYGTGYDAADIGFDV